MASESPAATMESVDGTTPSTVSSRRSAEARGRRLERERARRRQRLASETAAEGEAFVSASSSGQSTTCRPLLADQRDTPRADGVC